MTPSEKRSDDVLQKTYEWLKNHRLGIIAALLALVVSFLTGRKLGSDYAHRRSAVDRVLPELERARQSVEGTAEHAEHSAESISAGLGAIERSEEAVSGSLDAIRESRDIGQRIQKIDSENDRIVLELARRREQRPEGTEDTEFLAQGGNVRSDDHSWRFRPSCATVP